MKYNKLMSNYFNLLKLKDSFIQLGIFNEMIKTHTPTTQLTQLYIECNYVHKELLDTRRKGMFTENVL